MSLSNVATENDEEEWFLESALSLKDRNFVIPDIPHEVKMEVDYLLKYTEVNINKKLLSYIPSGSRFVKNTKNHRFYIDSQGKSCVERCIDATSFNEEGFAFLKIQGKIGRICVNKKFEIQVGRHDLED